MNTLQKLFKELHSFLILWSTQSFSALGSSMTSFALIIWSYQQEGSALDAAMLSVCSYAPYVVMSIFAGALSDQWNKKMTMLVCDSFAALCTVVLLLLLQAGRLEIWHLYGINALNGFMNILQQPAADVTISLLSPKEHYQKVSGMRSFSNSLVSIFTPVFATTMLTLFGIQAVILFDLVTFGVAFLALLFLAAINLTASVFNAALPAMLLSRNGGSETALGVVNAVTGVTMLIGSVLASVLPAPKSRVGVICNTLLISMSTENFFLALGQSVPQPYPDFYAGTGVFGKEYPSVFYNSHRLLSWRIFD